MIRLLSCIGLFYCFFFFQAEDGIRDDLVTGVQTYALPIWPSCRTPRGKSPGSTSRRPSGQSLDSCQRPSWWIRPMRSEERRVGKSVDLGGRSRSKKKKRNK